MLKIVKFSQRFSAQCRPILQCNSVKLPPFRADQIVTGFHHSVWYRSKDGDANPNDEDPTKVTPNIASKYELFTDDKATVILDVEEERDKMLAGELEIEEIEDDTHNAFAGLNTEREYDEHLKINIISVFAFSMMNVSFRR